MCGIFGYIGFKRNATEAVFDGLKRLDYRGYDSWGIACIKDKKILLTKHVGTVDKKLLDLPQSRIAIGHTRWATNGAVNQINAHPHFSTNKSFVLAQNGVMENFEQVKFDLIKKGYKFLSDTDTEVIVRLIEEETKTETEFVKAVRKAFNKCEGRNTIIILTNKGEVIAARNGSPLVLGFTEGYEEMYFSSDTLSFSPFVEQTITVKNGEMVVFKNKAINIFQAFDGKAVKLMSEEVVIKNEDVSKGKFGHYMLKEIYEQPDVIKRIINDSSESGLIEFAQKVKRFKTVYVIGSGTAGAAAAQIAFYLRFYAKVNAISLIGAEANEYQKLFDKNDLIISPSQSGETADVLEVLEFAKAKSVTLASLVNMPGSLMTAMSDYKFMTNAGPEICVMSTKVFVAQIVWGYLLAKAVEGKFNEGKKELEELSKNAQSYLNDNYSLNKIKELALDLSQSQDILLMAKGQTLQIAKEGMIKIIEGSYIHAHAISAGDLKHYAITLITDGFPVIAISGNDFLTSDLLTAVNEVKARGAKIILVTNTEDKKSDYNLLIPKQKETQAVMSIIPLQLLSYHLALYKGNNIDKPRNIAKSVTVK